MLVFTEFVLYFIAKTLGTAFQALNEDIFDAVVPKHPRPCGERFFIKECCRQLFYLFLQQFFSAI